MASSIRFNVRNLELDQLAATSLQNGTKRSLLLRQIPHFESNVSALEKKFGGFHTYIPTGVMSRRLNNALRNVLAAGKLEYSKINVDRRGHFFEIGPYTFCPEGDDDVFFMVSNHTANRWAAEENLRIVEDIGKLCPDHYMRVYRCYEAPDIHLADIDLICIRERPLAAINELFSIAAPEIGPFLESRLVRLPVGLKWPDERLVDIITRQLGEQPFKIISEGQKHTDLTQFLFWEIQKAMAGHCDYNACFPPGIKSAFQAIRAIISADPQLFGKTGDAYYDPLGIINYLIKTGRVNQ